MALSLLLAGNAAMAQEVSEDEARSRALQFLSTQSDGPRRAKGLNVSTDLSLAYTSRSEAKTCFYVFNVGDGDGFVIAGGDQAARPILGYCDHGTFDLDKAPDNFKWWLSQYTEQIAHAVPKAESTDVSPARRANTGRAHTESRERYSVEPLIKTTWGQLEPYNCKIPQFSEDHYYCYYTGCVATAMAQIMNYWKYPEKGTGSDICCYVYRVFDEELGDWGEILVGEHEVDFSDTYYDWDHMLDDYKYIWLDEDDDFPTPLFTEEEASAVGTLMYHAGVAVNMCYDDGDSWAWNRTEVSALKNHFGYDESIDNIQRNFSEENGSWNISDEIWENIIYNELDEERPVFYNGGGHAFICDGYDSETNMFHFNLGWDGDCDGYYYLTGLDNTSSVANDFITNGEFGEITFNIMPDNFSKKEVDFWTYYENTYFGIPYPVYLGGTLPIEWTSGYDGTPVFSSSDESVATIDANGVIMGVSEGAAKITAFAPSTDNYYRKVRTFNVVVGDVEFTKQPYFNNDNNVYEDDYTLYYTLQNQFPIMLRGCESISVGFEGVDIATLSNSIDDLPSQEARDYEFTLNWNNHLTGKFAADQQYTINLYKGYNVPLNYPSVTFTYRNKLTVDYGVSPAGYGTLILPFNAELPEGMTVYTCPEVDDNGVLTLEEDTSIRRNVPYIVKGTYGESYQFVGPEAIDADKPLFTDGILVGAVTKDVPLQKGTDYILQVQDDKAAFYRYMGTKSDNDDENDSLGNRLAAQFRAFLRLEGAQNAKLFLPGMIDEETEGIATLRADGSTPAGIYTIDGHRHDELQKGLNILILGDGTAQKVFVK